MIVFSARSPASRLSAAEEDALPRPGLARHRGEAGLEFQRHLLQERQVADLEETEASTWLARARRPVHGASGAGGFAPAAFSRVATRLKSSGRRWRSAVRRCSNM